MDAGSGAVFSSTAHELRRTKRMRLGRRIIELAVLLTVLLGSSPLSAHANYFSTAKFTAYSAAGRFPFWSSSWVPLERRIFLDAQGIPYVQYSAGKSYNATTVSLIGLLAYDRFLDGRKEKDRTQFLQIAQWLRAHQDESCGCWAHDFDLTHSTLDETMHAPWASAMTQGLALSVLTRAYALGGDAGFLHAAKRGMLPFEKPVQQGGVRREFLGFAPAADAMSMPFFEEYPTQPDPSYTLNGFMFALLGLYDLAQTGNVEAGRLFADGMRTLHAALPLYDLGDGSSYDLTHLTRAPRGVHRDLGYHLVHITELNALGSATQDATLLWYRDRWNGYGNRLDAEAVWLEHFGIWILFRGRWLLVIIALMALACGQWLVRLVRARTRRGTASGVARPVSVMVGS